MLSDEARFRRFARAVTTEVGALEESFLGLGRSLGAARVLNAIGRGIAEVAEIRAYLRLDSGLMSRLLRGLEAEGLVTVSQDSVDGRRRVAALTKAGRRAFRAYEKLSDARARRLLDARGRSGSLLAAMDLVATALTAEQVDIQAVDPGDARAKYCLDQYYTELRARFEAGFDVAKSRDPAPAAMLPPRGAFLLAVSDGLPIGCGALCGDGSPVAEVKRVWVAGCARGFGIARRLMSAIEAIAREQGIRELRLDTNKALPEAIGFYEAAGWRRIDRFNDDPYAHHFFAKSLVDAPSRPARVKA
jgi:DNA-binding MarR family transcriptional regulator/GNAT superfamily N-acetyltransferase